MPTDEPIEVTVVATAYEADRIVSFTLARPGGGALPPWEAGAHVDVHLPSGTVRQYSLCGDPRDPTRYRIAVLALPDGRGGSVETHRELRAGKSVTIGRPRQDFPLVEAPSHTLVAGGIGITPLLSMAHELSRSDADWRVVYCARNRDRMAFVDELAELGPTSLTLLDETTDGRVDPEQILKEAGEGVVYCCGPAGMLDAFTAAAESSGKTEQLHTERFSATPLVAADEGELAVELVRTGASLVVPADCSVLEAVRGAGIDVPSSCEQGICGTCETKVLGGTPDHRDSLLTQTEHEAGDTMMICVSRAHTGPLRLDL